MITSLNHHILNLNKLRSYTMDILKEIIIVVIGVVGAELIVDWLRTFYKK